MKKISVTLVICLLAIGFAPTAHALLGEKPAQLLSEYGQPYAIVTNPNLILGTNYYYRTGPYKVSVMASRGVSKSEDFQRLDGRALTTADVTYLLNREALPGPWVQWSHYSPAIGIVYMRPDGSTADWYRPWKDLFFGLAGRW